jgi:hypothetical protein
MIGMIRDLMVLSEARIRTTVRKWDLVQNERGSVTLEQAIVAAGLIAIAVAGLVILIARVRSNMENVPETVTPPG